MTLLFPNSAIVRAPQALVLQGGAWRSIDLGVRYGLFVHHRLGPVLIDTGYGPRVTQAGGRSLALRLYAGALQPMLEPNGAPLAQLAALGFGANDVARIIVTHFHADHVAALGDFPAARIVARGDILRQLQGMSAATRLRHGVFMELLPADLGQRVIAVEQLREIPLPFGLGSGRDLFGDESCIAVDLPGHALGHFGLLFSERDRPLLFAVDVTWLGDALPARLPEGPARLIYSDIAAMRISAGRVAAAREAGCQIVLSHEQVT